MARYNTVATTGSYSNTATLTTPNQGTFSEFTGAGGFTVQLPNPALFAGSNQVFYNASSGTVTISTTATSGSINGPGTNNTTSLALPTGTTQMLYSDGTNWIAIGEDGGPLVATTMTASSTVTLSPAGANVVLSPTGSGVVTIAPATAGTINNMSIGATTASTGAFTTLSASGVVNFTDNITGSAYNTGNTLTVTGSVGISSTLFTNGAINSSGLLSLTASTGSHSISSTSVGTGYSTGNSLQVGGGLGVANNAFFGGNLTLGNSSTNTVTFNGYVNTAIIPSTNNTYNLGSSTLGWANVYTNDLHLSNGIGDYTIVEGEEDLFLYNNKNGKVYKFMVQEVDPANATPKNIKG
jgi:hypothetical protein